MGVHFNAIMKRRDSSDGKVAWIELFYDLAFVAAIASYATTMSFGSVMQHILFLIALWWSWMGFSFFASRFDSRNTIVSLITVLKIIATGGMGYAAFMSGETGIRLFAGSYAFSRILLLVLYGFAYRYIPETRTLVRKYMLGFTLAIIPWVAIVFAPQVAILLAFIGIIVDVGTPLLSINSQADAPPHMRHLRERFALFFLIIVGEVFISMMRAGEETAPSVEFFVSGALTVILTFLLWWTYFSHLHDFDAKDIRQKAQLWMYAHLPLMIGTIFLAVSLKKLLLVADWAAVPGYEGMSYLFSLATTLGALSCIQLLSLHDHEHGIAYQPILLRAILAVILIALTIIPAPLSSLHLLLIGILPLSVISYWEYRTISHGIGDH